MITDRLTCNNETTCGIQTNPPHTSPHGNGATTFIVGGREAVPHSWPWQVIHIIKLKSIMSFILVTFFGQDIFYKEYFNNINKHILSSYKVKSPSILLFS